MNMKKEHHKFTEHYLVPAVLFLFNICLVHLIYVFVPGSAYSVVGKIALAIALALMGISLFHKKQVLLISAILFYTLVAFWA